MRQLLALTCNRSCAMLLSVIRGQYFLHLNRKFIYEGLFRYPGGKARRLAVGRKPCFRFGTDCFDVNLEGDRRSSSREEVFTLTANRPLVFVLRSHKHSHPLNGVERGLKDFVVRSEEHTSELQ